MVDLLACADSRIVDMVMLGVAASLGAAGAVIAIVYYCSDYLRRDKENRDRVFTEILNHLTAIRFKRDQD